MSDRTGLGLVEVAVLEATDALDARPYRPHRKSAQVVQRAQVDDGVGPRYAYDALCWMAAPWLVHLRLVDLHGNGGSPDDRAAAARYTEVRLSESGAMALAAERGELPRLPVGLINGDLATGGTTPSFDPAAIVRTVQRAGADAGVTDRELEEIVGPPSFVTGCAVTGDVGALRAGELTTLQLQADIQTEHDGERTMLLLSKLPVGIGVELISQAIVQRVESAARAARRNVQLSARMGIALRDVRDMSAGDQTLLVCEVTPGADVDECRERILETWPVTIKVPVQLAAPLATLVRRCVDDPPRQAAVLDALLATSL